LAEAKEKTKKNEYQKTVEAYGQAMKAFHKDDLDKTIELLNLFLEKHAKEKELVDRAKMYLSICEGKKVKKTDPLKTFEDHYHHSVYKLNMGDEEEAMKSLEKAAQMKSKEGKIPYLMAVAAIRAGNQEQCLEHLKKAVKLDESFGIMAQNEPDFESIREKEEFKQII
jgi:tetratricopeptide (TPR) repeat protein